MGIAETARLLASLELQDRLSPAVGPAVGAVDRLDSRIGGLQGRLGALASNLRGGVSNALSTFGGRIRQVGLGLAGFLGVGGLLGIGQIFRNSVGGAQEFGEASLQMSRATGLAVDQASRLVDVFDYFSISGDKASRIAGMYEKNIDRLAGTKQKAAAFEKEYGLRVSDNSGKQLDFNKQLLASADFFNNKSIPASEKAAALAKLYGKSWQDLLPLLAEGRRGIEEAQKKALSLSEADLKAITENKKATRDWNDAWGDLQIKIGLGILPTLTEGLRGLTSWVESHGPEIQDFFRNGVQTVKGIAGTAIDVISGIKSVWDGIPKEVRDLLITGLIADRTVKFLFGFSVTGLVKDLVGGIAGGLGGALVRAGIGKAFVQPVWVTNPQFGAGAPGAGVPAAAGGIGLAGLVASVLAIIGTTYFAHEAFVLKPAQAQAGTNITATEQVIASGDANKIRTALTGLDTSVKSLSGLQRVLYDLNAQGVKVHTESLAAALAAALSKAEASTTAAEKTKGGVDWSQFQQAEEKQEEKLTAIQQAVREQRISTKGGLDANRSAVQAGTRSVVSAIDRQQLLASIPIIVSIAGVVVRTYQGSTWLQRSTSGGNIRGGAD